MKSFILSSLVFLLAGQFSHADCDADRSAIGAFISACQSQAPVSCVPGMGTGPQAYRAVTKQDVGSFPATFYISCEAQACDGHWGISANGPTISTGCSPLANTDRGTSDIQKPVNSCGSIIQTSNQVLGESIPLVGISFDLNYFTNWVPGRIADYKANTAVTGSYVPSTATGYAITVKNEIGSTVATPTFGASTNQNYTFTWNGLDASSIETIGRVNYTFVKVENASDFNSTFTSVVAIGSLKSKKLGLGGWAPSIWHFYDFASSTLFNGDGSIRKIQAVVDGSYYRIVEEDASLVYYFDSSGLISHTKLGLTGTTVYTFAYNGSGYLTAISEPFGRTTTFNRDGSGNFVGITAPNGAYTSVTLNGNGYLATVTNPNSEVYSMTYVNAAGLLYTFTKPNTRMSTFSYDTDGNLTADVHSSGYSTAISKSLNVTTSTSAEGRIKTNTTSVIPNGPSSQLIREDVVLPSGTAWYARNASGNDISETFYPNWNSTVAYNSNPRFPEALTIGGTYLNNFGSRNSTFTSTVSPSSPSDPFSFTTLTNVENVGNSILTSTYTASSQTNVFSTKLGRTETTVIDSYQRPTSIQKGSLTATTFSYTNEKLTGINQGARSTVLSYNGSDLVSSILNAASQATAFTYDSAQRLSTQTLPDSRVIYYTYDSQGNLVSITPPSKPAHTFNIGANELVSSYLAPTLSGVSSATISYSYNNDRQLTQITRPSGATINYNYNATTGLLSTITGTFGTITPTYTNEQLTHLVDHNNMSASQGFAGRTPSSLSVYDAASVILSSYSRSPDATAGEKIGSETISGGASGTQTINYGYDDDEYLTSAGSMTMTYNTPNGLLTGTVLGNVNDTYTYNTFGEVTGYTAKYNTTTIYSYTLTRDNLGRVTQKVEFLNGVTTTFDYTYDSVGRLTQVNKNGVTDSSYTYDGNSNRSGGSIHGTATTASYDDQDRIKTFNLNTYTHNADGERTQKVNSGTGVTTNYIWGAFGNNATVKIGTVVYNYGLDPFHNRYQKQKGSAIQKRWMFNPEGQLVGELSSTNALQKTFVYATKSHVPDYFIDASNIKYRIITDYLGSVRLVVKTTNGTIQQRMEHDEFGRVITDTVPAYQPFGFAGGHYDKDTGLVKFGARIYDPETGRWLSKDPILFSAGDPNVYSYTMQDPINWIDPTGLARCLYDRKSHTMRCVSNDGGSAYFSSDFASGRGAGFNNPNNNNPFEGPIPPGVFDIGKVKPGTSRRPLTPIEGTDTGNRNSFQTHRCGNKSLDGCSQGCVVKPDASDFNQFLGQDEGANILYIK